MDKKELIAKYFTKKLSQKDKIEFDQMMVTDSEFAKEVKFQDNIKTVIKKEERDLVKQQLQGFEVEQNTYPNYTKWLVAASLVLLVGISSFWFLNNTIDAEKLYSENFEPYRNIVHPILRGETKTDLKTKAFKAYETKKYDEALVYFNTLLKENPDETIAFYKANVLLKLDKIEDAMAIFKINLKTPDSLDAKNNWYLALAYLRLSDIDNAKDILVTLNTTSEFKNKNVKDLLEQLK